MRSITDFARIPARKYEGYVWYSDMERPITLQGDKEYQPEERSGNGFLLEALLYCRKERTSLMIRHEGHPIICEFALDELPGGHILEDKKYFPHRLGDGVKRVCFSKLWLPETDPLCENMVTMRAKAFIFTGFNH